MSRESNRSFDWSVALIVLMVGVLTLSLMPSDRINWSVRRIAGAVALLGPTGGNERSDVLILSRQASDQFAVTATLAPRGYTIHVVPTAKAALAELRRQSNRIDIVVVDEALPEARGTLAAARKLRPEACPVLLKGPREPAQVAKLLVDALDRHITLVQARELREEAVVKRGTVSR
jgi:CheY-like chemotaxis protein